MQIKRELEIKMEQQPSTAGRRLRCPLQFFLMNRDLRSAQKSGEIRRILMPTSLVLSRSKWSYILSKTSKDQEIQLYFMI